MTDSAMTLSRPILRAAPRWPQVKFEGRSGDNSRRSSRRAWPGLSRFSHYATRPLSSLGRTALGCGLAAALAVGWLNRDQDYLVPDNGPGYWIGIAGAGLMLLLLLYPLRKRVRSLRNFGSVVFWFRLHMIFGLIGPALILFHSNFKLGSLNSDVAMAAMLVVATSGIVGRYLYGKIHLGLNGHKAQVREILADIESMRQVLGDDLAVGDLGIAELGAFAERALVAPCSLPAALCGLPVLSVRAHRVSRRVLRDMRQTIARQAKRRGWSRNERKRRFGVVAELVTLYLAAVKKAATFAFYERVFHLWHILHLPLFVILILAASVHIVAAHLF